MLEIRRVNDYNSIFIFLLLKDRYRLQTAKPLGAYQAALRPANNHHLPFSYQESFSNNISFQVHSLRLWYTSKLAYIIVYFSR